jgi:hypothetical protein
MNTVIFMSLLSSQMGVEECLGYLPKLLELGLPITRAEAFPAPSDTVKTNQRLVQEAAKIVKPGRKISNPTRFNEILTVLSGSIEPLVVVDYLRPHSYTALKAVLRPQIEQSLSDFKSGRTAEATQKLIVCRKLLDHTIWNGTLIGWLSGKAMSAIYTASLEKMKKHNPFAFRKVPQALLNDFDYPSFKQMLRGEYLSNYAVNIEVGTLKELSRSELQKLNPTDLEFIRVWLKNTSLAYPELYGARNWEDLARAYFNIQPELGIYEDGEDRIDFIAPACEAGAKMDKRITDENAKLKQLRTS